MSLKRILTVLIFTLCAFTRTHAEIPIGNNIRPSVKFSENREYFAVAMPRGFRDQEGYTAVFKTNTRELQFKVDSIISYDFKVSNDGKKLFVLEYEEKADKISYTILKFTAQEIKRSFLFGADVKRLEDVGVIWTLPTWKLLEDHILMTYKEQGYRILLPDFRMEPANAADIQFPERNYDQEDADFDEVFGVYQLKGNSSSLKTDLLTFLNATEVSDRKEADKYLFVKFIRKEDGTFGDVKVFSQFLKTSSGSLDEEQIEKIKTFLERYHFAENPVPKGVPYWYYSGPMLFVNKP